MRATALLDDLTAALAPPRCAICTRPCPPREVACRSCLAAIAAGPAIGRALPGLDAVVGAGSYSGPARQLVAGLKFDSRLALAGLAAGAMATALAQAPLDVAGLEEAGVVPAPPAPARLRRRGFDPADALAVELARLLRLPLCRCLRRSSARRQVGRTRSERLASPPRVRCAEPPPARVILVDDVLTTGATLAACARATRAEGADRVVALVFAIAPPGRTGPARSGALA